MTKKAGRTARDVNLMQGFSFVLSQSKLLFLDKVMRLVNHLDLASACVVYYDTDGCLLKMKHPSIMENIVPSRREAFLREEAPTIFADLFSPLLQPALLKPEALYKGARIKAVKAYSCEAFDPEKDAAELEMLAEATASLRIKMAASTGGGTATDAATAPGAGAGAAATANDPRLLSRLELSMVLPPAISKPQKKLKGCASHLIKDMEEEVFDAQASELRYAASTALRPTGGLEMSILQMCRRLPLALNRKRYTPKVSNRHGARPAGREGRGGALRACVCVYVPSTRKHARKGRFLCLFSV